MNAAYSTDRWDRYRVRHRNRRQQKCAWWLSDEDGNVELCMLQIGHPGSCLPPPRGKNRRQH